MVASSSADSTGDLTYTDDYVENSPTGILFSFTEVANVVSFNYTSTSTGTDANLFYSITILA
jgi:hypothetical protein